MLYSLTCRSVKQITLLLKLAVIILLPAIFSPSVAVVTCWSAVKIRNGQPPLLVPERMRYSLKHKIKCDPYCNSPSNQMPSSMVPSACVNVPCP